MAYHNGNVTAGVVQQGTGNAGHNIYNYNGTHLSFRRARPRLTFVGPVTIQRDPTPRPSPSSTVPFRRDRDFVSQDSLDQIRQKCNEPASRAALVGLGGVG